MEKEAPNPINGSGGGPPSRDADEPQVVEDWTVGFNEPEPMGPKLWGWFMMAALLAVQTVMISEYCAESTALSWGELPMEAAYVITQLISLAYSFVACNYLLPMFPTICGIPFFLIFFPPAFLLAGWPFFTDVGGEMAKNAPLWVLCAWSAVRLQFESIVQYHGNSGVKGVSWWLRWPIQKVPEAYTLTYPGIGAVTRTHGGNVDAFSSLTVGLPTAIILAIVNNDESTGMQVLAWIAQVWMFVYLCCLGPVPHFLGGMPGPNNIFDFHGGVNCRMHALTSKTLGVCCFWIASYAVVHFIVFVRVFSG